MDLSKAKRLAAEAAADDPTFQAPKQLIIPEVVPARVCNIDGDFLAYFAAGGESMAAGISRNVARDRIEKFRIMSGSGKSRVHLSSGDCNKGLRFLVAQAEPYQGQRAGKKPKNWLPVREFLEEYTGELCEIKKWRTREADDGAAYCCETLSGGLDAVASKDKDWRMFAGLHIDWDTFQLTQVNPGDYRVDGANGKVYGHYFFWWQMLRGDTADHIPGIPMCGEQTATAYLDGTTSNADAFRVVADVYKTKRKRQKDWADYFCEQASLLWMRTDRIAHILDFLKVIPTDSPDLDEILSAAQRLSDRVQHDLEILESIKNAAIKTER